MPPRSSSSTTGKLLSDILTVASITKTLSQSGTQNLQLPVPLTHTLVHQILDSTYLHPSRKLDFFNWCLSHLFKHSASTYTHMLNVLSTHGFLQEILPLLHSMKGNGVSVGSGTYKSLLDSFIRSGKFESALDVLDHMENMGVNLNNEMYNSVLVALLRNNQVDLALAMFFKVFEDVDSVPGLHLCNELLVALRKRNRREEFRNVFNRLREKVKSGGFEFDTWGYNICIHAFGQWGDLAMSLKLFGEMKAKSVGSGSFGPDLCTYNSLIQALCLAGKVRDALVVWEEMKNSGHEPDAFTYGIMIQGCCKSYRVDDATKIFSEMQYNGFQPHVIVYNSLLNGLLKARRVVDACQLFDKMVQEGVRASCWTYNILIDGLFKNGRAEGAYTLFCDLKKKGQFVDGVTYSIVVMRFCKEGQLEEALELVREMENRGFIVDLLTITSLLIEFYKQGWWDGTEMLMKHIREGNLVPRVHKWKADMEAALKNPQSRGKDYMPMFPSRGDFCEIMSLNGHSDLRTATETDSESRGDEDFTSGDFDDWSSSPYMDLLASQAKHGDHAPALFSLSKGQRVQGQEIDSFDIDMVNTFLSIFLAKGKLSLACKLFEIFNDMGINSTSYTYNSLMSSFVKKGYYDEAWGVLNEMGEKVCPADIATYNVIFQGLGKMGRADLASSILDKLMKQGGYLDIVMYNTLINALGKAGRLNEACKLFEQMRSNGINPDVVTFNTLIEVHSKAGRLKDAYKFLKMMLDAGCSPNHVTDTTLDYLGKEIEKLRYQKASIIRVTKDD